MSKRRMLKVVLTSMIVMIILLPHSKGLPHVAAAIQIKQSPPVKLYIRIGISNGSNSKFDTYISATTALTNSSAHTVLAESYVGQITNVGSSRIYYNNTLAIGTGYSYCGDPSATLSVTASGYMDFNYSSGYWRADSAPLNIKVTCSGCGQTNNNNTQFNHIFSRPLSGSTHIYYTLTHALPEAAQDTTKFIHGAPIVNGLSGSPATSDAGPYVSDLGKLSFVHQKTIETDRHDISSGIQQIRNPFNSTVLTLADPGPPQASEYSIEQLGGLQMPNTTIYEKIGTGTWDRLVTDSAGDGVRFSVDYILKTATSPDIVVKYSDSGVDRFGDPIPETAIFNPIGANPITGGIEGWSNQPLQARVSSSIPGKYCCKIWDDNGNQYLGPDLTDPAFYNLTTETTASGIHVRGQLVDQTNTIPLSEKSPDVVLKIDLTPPEPALQYTETTNKLTDQSSDALSGINGDLTQVAVVPPGSDPTPADYVDLTDWATCPQYVPGDNYDIYATAFDKAGNSKTVLALPNTYLRSTSADLEIGKQVTGNHVNTSISFQVTITLWDENGVLVDGETYQTSGTAVSNLTFQNGKADVYLKHDETIVIKDLPELYQYQVQETDSRVVSGSYTATYTGTGTVDPGNAGMTETLGIHTCKVEITNLLNEVPGTGIRDHFDPNIAGMCVGGTTLLGALFVVWNRKRKPAV